VPFLKNPFFQTWELRGRYPTRGYPKIFNDEAVGSEAKKLFDDAQAMLKQIVADGSMTLRGVVGIFPTNRSGDGEDIDIYETEEARESGSPLSTFCMLRQQAEKESEDPYLSQADFIAPAGYKDHLLGSVFLLTPTANQRSLASTTVERSSSSCTTRPSTFQKLAFFVYAVSEISLHVRCNN
jgi:cobalamin-dependent methionine synthase I